jgi:hypothetical protein
MHKKQKAAENREAIEKIMKEVEEELKNKQEVASFDQMQYPVEIVLEMDPDCIGDQCLHCSSRRWSAATMETLISNTIFTFLQLLTCPRSAGSQSRFAIANYFFPGWVNFAKFAADPFKLLNEWEDKATNVHASTYLMFVTKNVTSVKEDVKVTG